MIDAVGRQFSSEGFLPRGLCGDWPDLLVWEHLTGLLLAWIAFLSMPVLIWRLVRRRPGLSPFSQVLWSFGVFVGLSGLDHLLDMIAFRHPMYRLSGHVLLLMGLASWWWAWAMFRAWPALMTMKGPAELERIICERTDELALANARLQEGEARFRQIAEGLPQLVWTARPDGGCDYLSPQWLNYTGVPQADQLGDGWLQQVHPDDRATTWSRWRISVESLVIYDMEYRLRGADGEDRWFKARGMPLYDDQGRVLKWFGSNTDIHAERLQAEALRESEDRQRRTLATARLGHWEWDLNAGLIDHQDATRILYGRDEGQPFREVADYVAIIHPEDREIVKWAARRTLASGVPFELDYRVVWPDGSVHWIAGRGGMVRHRDGSAVRLVGVNMDITQQKHDEEQIRTLNETLERRVTDRTAALAQATDELRAAKDAAVAATRAKGDFLANMSHEIRSPMNGVIGLTDLLAETDLDETQRGYTTLIQNSAEALLIILDDILDLSKIEAGKLRLEVAPMDLAALCEEVTHLIAVQSPEKRLRVSCRVDPTLPPRLLGDGVRIRQVLVNLMGNAVKFTEAGEVVLDVAVISRSDSRVGLALSVRDTGVGIAPSKQALIFESFAQVQGASNRRHGGTGLGLTICRRLTELMGGQIRVESRPGEGSTFRVDLDLDIADPNDEASLLPAVSPLKSPFPHPLRVLLAEDHEVNRLVACEMIRRMGCQVDVAGDGFEALACLEHAQYDVVLMDVQMPGMDGLAATRELRRREAHRNRHIPVIAMTANAMVGDEQRCLDAGMDAYLAKPIRPGLLREALQRCCFSGPAPSPTPSAVAPPEANAAFDPDLLNDCCAGDSQVVGEVMDSFLKSAPESLASIHASIEAQDPQELQRTAHRFKGACQTMGARPLVEGCRTLLSMARSHDLTAARSAFDEMIGHWDRVKGEILAHRDTLARPT